MVETIVPFNCLSVTRFHYYIFYLGKVIIAALVHWVKFAFHLNFGQLHPHRHFRRMSSLLPPNWDGWPLHFTITHYP